MILRTLWYEYVLYISTWKDLSTPKTLSVKVSGATDTGDVSFSHKLPGDQISWLRFLIHKFNGVSETSSEIFV